MAKLPTSDSPAPSFFSNQQRGFSMTRPAPGRAMLRPMRNFKLPKLLASAALLLSLGGCETYSISDAGYRGPYRTGGSRGYRGELNELDVLGIRSNSGVAVRRGGHPPRSARLGRRWWQRPRARRVRQRGARRPVRRDGS